jgi:putative endonuclease
MYYVHVLLSLEDSHFYIGFSENIKKRLADHNAGRNTSTKPRRPFELIYYGAHFSKEGALRREAYFKTTKGKTTLKQMLRATLKLKINQP